MVGGTLFGRLCDLLHIGCVGGVACVVGRLQNMDKRDMVVAQSRAVVDIRLRWCLGMGLVMLAVSSADGGCLPPSAIENPKGAGPWWLGVAEGCCCWLVVEGRWY